MQEAVNKTCNIRVQYVRAVSAVAHVRPYQNRFPLSNAIAVELSTEALPEAGHHRLELGVTVTGTNSEGVLCFEVSSVHEAIVVHENLTEEELKAMLESRMAGLLLGNVRVSISNASAQTGYGPVTLPPLSNDQLRALAQQGKSQ